MPDDLGTEAGTRAARPMIVRATALDAKKHPDMKRVASVVLSNGPRRYREATYWVLVDRHTQKIHHESVVIKTHRKRKGKISLCDRRNSVTIDTEAEDDLQKLVDFISTCRTNHMSAASGNYVVLKTSEALGASELQRGLDQLTATGKGDVIANLLRHAADKPQVIEALLQHAETDPAVFVKATAALNLAKWRQGVAELETLMETSKREQDFQNLLARHPWMFGSEYSEQLDRRRWTRDENADFMVRRTADAYIELIEIKTPEPKLFNFDASHKCFYPSSQLSMVLGQVQNYIDKLDRDRDRIKATDGEDTAKIRAKIIVGRDGEAGNRDALRRLNGHLHRIEVMTFDQLLRIAGRVIEQIGWSLREPLPSADHIDVPEATGVRE